MFELFAVFTHLFCYYFSPHLNKKILNPLIEQIHNLILDNRLKIKRFSGNVIYPTALLSLAFNTEEKYFNCNGGLWVPGHTFDVLFLNMVIRIR